MREQKFIIARVKGKLRHFVGTKGWSGEDHLIIARHNNISEIDIVEKGFLIDRTIEVWECYDKKHLHKIKTKMSKQLSTRHPLTVMIVLIKS